MAPQLTPAQRFWAKVEFTATCWLWTATLTRKGYGQFYPTTTPGVPAHRWAYEFCIGAIPEGLQIDHLCRVRRCVRPDHLEVVTPRENHRRGLAPLLLAQYLQRLRESGELTGGAIAMRERQWAKLHCPQGHPYDSLNTSITAKGHRNCRTCHRNRQAQRWRNLSVQERAVQIAASSNRRRIRREQLTRS